MSSRLALLALLALLAGCGGFERGDPLPEEADQDLSGGDDDTVSPSFATTVEPVLVRLCAGCHGAGGVASSTRFTLSLDPGTDFTTVSALVDTSAAAGSRLLSKGTGNAHGGGVVLTAGSSDYQTIFAWIAGGAAP
jgi:hypothetical protein